MNITITEALRIKNELSNTIKTLTYSTHQSSFGITTEDGTVISQDKDQFADVEASLIKGLGFSEELNNTIAAFNKETLIDVTIRKMQNAKLLLDVYTRNLPKTKPTTQKRFENLGTVRQSIEVIYTPSISGKDMKDKISVQKAIIRDLQSQVEKLNQSEISVGFDYSDLESLIG